MSDKKIKHFVLTRFFPVQVRNYPHDVLDVDFLSKQLPLAKNMLMSLENQTNQDFETVFITNPKFFDDPNYEFIFSTLRDSTTLPLTFVKRKEDRRLVKEALNDYKFVITTRMDFDDFVYKDAVADTQSKVNECENVLGYGYCKGYRYACKELARTGSNWNGIGHIGIFQSLIFKSSYAQNLPSIATVFDFGHHVFKVGLQKFFEKNGVEFSESMFQQNTSARAFIYVRHDFSRNLLTKAPDKHFTPPKKPLTTADITREQLKAEFNFDHELNSIK